MAGIIKLREPVMIDGAPVSEMRYDIDKISPEQFVQAEAYANRMVARMGFLSAKVPELDSGFHYYLGVMAIVAENPGWEVIDVERVSGPDIMKMVAVGSDFMTGDAEEEEERASGSPEAGEAEGTEDPGDLPEDATFPEEQESGGWS